MAATTTLRCDAINTGHKDLIHDIAFNLHGDRMATCSSDQQIKVWDYCPETGAWKETSSWKAHSGSTWKITWAAPEFGQVLASCSFDRTAAVWEEISSDAGTETNWMRRTNLVDSRTTVMDVKFAPKIMGLLLATCSVDGVVRIYEAPDVMNLSQWTLQHEIATKISCSCITWNPSNASCYAYGPSKIIIPFNAERKDSPGVSETADRIVVKCPIPLEKKDVAVAMPRIPMIAVGSDDSKDSSNSKVVILEYTRYYRKWVKVENFPSILDAVNDLAFAPRSGRAFDILAVATKEVKIYTIVHVLDCHDSRRLQVQLAASFNDHQGPVWRVSWNIVGSILSSSGDDGVVRVWKCSKSGDKPWYLKRRYAGHSNSMDSEGLRRQVANIPNDFGVFAQGLLSKWKCECVIKGDGSVSCSDSADHQAANCASPLHNFLFLPRQHKHPASDITWG